MQRLQTGMAELGPAYGAILMDPPWRFETWSAKGRGRSPKYNTHGPASILNIVGGLPAADDCALFLWAIDPLLPQAFDLFRLLGFKYKTVAFTWAKTGKTPGVFPIGTGYWTRANPEMCLLGTRGKPQRQSKAVRQLIIAPRREHSRKPDEIYSRIERLVDGPYLEMFGRQKWPGWDQWGNEVEKFNV